MSEHPANSAASIHARLANEARKLGRPFNEELQYYGMERFLYRLSKTQYAGSFILKGGLVLYVWDLPLRRPTRDIDFLGSVENRKDTIYQVIVAAIEVPAAEDGIRFNIGTVIVEETQVDADQKGIRVKFTGSLGRARIPIQIDIGFSDEITSKANNLRYPTILHDLAAPELKGYPLESIVSEKFHAMQRYAEFSFECTTALACAQKGFKTPLCVSCHSGNSGGVRILSVCSFAAHTQNTVLL